MISIIIRTAVMFILVMFSLRIMGKKNLGEFQPSDLVSTMLISNLTSIAIEAPELPVFYSIVPILLIMCFVRMILLVLEFQHRILLMKMLLQVYKNKLMH